MKIPIIRQFFQSHTPDELEITLNVIENFTAFRGVNEEELNVAGELITNICGALEVHESVKNGTSEKDALNGFAQRVMGSIDK